jgi:RNA polymerase sigma-70 factor (ECF subfamily)
MPRNAGGQHMRWEPNDLARRLDEQPSAVELREGQVSAPSSSDSGLSPAGRRILEAIEDMPEGERETFDLVKVPGLTYAEAAEVRGVSVRTAKRWVSRGLRLLTTRLADLGRGDTPTELA